MINFKQACYLLVATGKRQLKASRIFFSPLSAGNIKSLEIKRFKTLTLYKYYMLIFIKMQVVKYWYFITFWGFLLLFESFSQFFATFHNFLQPFITFCNFSQFITIFSTFIPLRKSRVLKLCLWSRVYFLLHACLYSVEVKLFFKSRLKNLREIHVLECMIWTIKDFYAGSFSASGAFFVSLTVIILQHY